MQEQKLVSAVNRPVSRQLRAFTLVELLVVIGIIALLISILLPSLNSARQQAQAIKCAANLRSIGQALNFYINDNKQLLPPGYTSTVLPPGDPLTGSQVNWTSVLVSLMDRKAGPTNSAADLKNNATGSFRKTFLCPSVNAGSTDFDPNDIGVSHYTSHPRLMPDMTKVDSYKGGTGLFRQYRITKVKRSSETALAFDGSLYLVTSTWNMGSGGPGGVGNQTTSYYRPRLGRPVAFGMDETAVLYALHKMIMDYGTGTSARNTTPIKLKTTAGMENTDQIGNDNNIRFRHSKNTQMNALFVDGHVGTFRLSPANLRANPAIAGDLTQNNIMLDSQ